MTDTEIRIEIAEKCGWTSYLNPSNEEMEDARLGRGAYKGISGYPIGGGPLGGMQFTVWKSPDGKHGNPPDYPNDLNACHEMEKTLTSIQWNLYTHFMEVVTRADIVSWLPGWQDINPARLIDACLVHPTARQRCEAFLRVHGLWKE